MHIFPHRLSCWEELRDSVKISTIWFKDPTLTRLMTPYAIFSLIKCTSFSKCLVLSWKAGYKDSLIAKSLSQKGLTRTILENFKSYTNFSTQIISQVNEPRALYSDSVEDLEMVDYLLLLQDIRELPK